MSLFLVNLVASSNLGKQYAVCKKLFSKYLQNPSKIPVKLLIFSIVKKKNSKFFFLTLLKINTFTGNFQGTC